MKKQLVLTILYITIITFSPLLNGLGRQQTTKPIKSVDDIYDIAINQLQKHLTETNLIPSERNNLINKLLGYFAPPAKYNIFLKNKQAQLIYSNVTKSYNEILTAQKNPQQKNPDKAKKFAEQALGKILLYKSPANQKTKIQCKNY